MHESPEVCLSEVDVGLPTRERVWLPVIRLPTWVAVALLDADDLVVLVRRCEQIASGLRGNGLRAGRGSLALKVVIRERRAWVPPNRIVYLGEQRGR